ncbi:hypothetical protein ACR9MF_07980 [Helicobacter pylori]
MRATKRPKHRMRFCKRLGWRQVCTILFDFANAKTASANAYAFKLRCAFVHAR